MLKTVKERLHRAIDELPDEDLAPEELRVRAPESLRHLAEALSEAGLIAALNREVRVERARPSLEATTAVYGELSDASPETNRKVADLLAQLNAGWDDAIERLLVAEGGAVEEKEIAQALGLSIKEVRLRADQHQILALRRPDGTDAYPAWQLDGGQLLPGLPEALAAHRAWGPEVATWFLNPHPALGGRRPIDALREGKRSLVARLAAASGETGGT